MPQRKRKVPFSGKAKKQQLQMKKLSKSDDKSDGKKKPWRKTTASSDDDETDVEKLNYQPQSSGSHKNLNRYVIKIHKELPAELEKRKKESYLPLNKVDEEQSEINLDDYFPEELDFPKRPKWDYSMSKLALESQESVYFSDYIKTLENKLFDWEDLSYFELNLETWRQLWRVLEMADILLIIVDIRFPALMFPPSLYKYVCETMKKNMIVVLNKIDLVPASVVVAWKHYFLSKFPELYIVYFTSLPGYNLSGKTSNKAGLQTRKKKGRINMAAEGAIKILQACEEIVEDKVDLGSWETKVLEEMYQEYKNEKDVLNEATIVETDDQDLGYSETDKYSGGILTIGCVGQPNVGKSSLMNALIGKKVVSVSKTPGHTKHFQTIFLTKNVRLCDCPGLMFPSKVPKQLQVLTGTFPIAQLKEPYSSLRYLAERVDLVKLLGIKHPESDEDNGEEKIWSPMDIADGWALKNRYYTGRAGRLDSYRAANQILRMALDGKICLCLYPPNYVKSKETWESHPDVEDVKWVQSVNKERMVSVLSSSFAESSDQSVEDREVSAPCSSKLSVSSNRTEESSDDNK